MSKKITVEPTSGASTNPLGIVFSATAILELLRLPEKIINKDVSGIQLTKIDAVGLYLEKGPFKALLPWSIIIVLEY